MAANKSANKVIDALNEVLVSELTSINQYFLHARLCEHWGFTKLWTKLKMESIDEMKHADVLMERILFLGGMPSVQKLGKINIGENVREMFGSDLALEKEAVTRLNRAIALARAESDNGSAELLAQILVSEEAHLNWIETQLALLDALGDANYLAQQVGAGGAA